MSAWINDRLPDDDMTVMLRLDDEDTRIWPGFRDGDVWRYADATAITIPVKGWMDFDDAAEKLGA